MNTSPQEPPSIEPPAHEPLDGLAEALEVLGDRWSLALVAHLLEAPLRFGSLQQRLPAISTNILSQRLRALQASGLVLATPYSRRPLRCTYELTSAGADLGAPLRLLERWGASRAGTSAKPPRHEPCETELELRWYCPSCEEALASTAAPPAEELYFA